VAEFAWNQRTTVPAIAAERDRLVGLLSDFVEAFDSGNLQMNSTEIDPGDPEIPPHPWHEEWLSLVRAVLDETRKP
jgi:hypothetical protein